MRLEGNRATAVVETGDRAEFGAGDHGGGGRHLDHLVLVHGGDGDLTAVAQGVAVHAAAPAAVGLHDLAAHRLGEDLVAEADADHRHVGRDRLAQEVLERAHPRQVVVDAVLGAHHQPAIGGGDRIGEHTVDHAPGAETQRRVERTEQALGHLGHGAMLVEQVLGRDARFEDADMHGQARCRAISGRAFSSRPWRATSLAMRSGAKFMSTKPVAVLATS